MKEVEIFFRDIIHNIALIVVLSVVYSLIYRRFRPHTPSYRFFSGLLFGGIALLAMLTPVRLYEGVVFDGRSIILSIAGFFGGPVVALISFAVTAAYRLWMGGDGALMGVLVITSSVLIGVAFYYIRQRDSRVTRPLYLLFFGIIVHAFMLLMTLALPVNIRYTVFSTIALPVMMVYSPATLIICLLLLGQEERIKMVSELSSNEEKLRRVLANMPVMLDAFDEDNNIIVWNRQCEGVTGYTADDVPPQY